MADVRCDRCGTEWIGIGLHTNGDCATIAALRIDLTAATERAERAEADLTAARALLREVTGRLDDDQSWSDLRARIEALLGRTE